MIVGRYRGENDVLIQCHYSTNRSEIYADVLSTMRMKIMKTEWRWRTRSLSKLRRRRRISQSRRSSVSERSWNKVYIHIYRSRVKYVHVIVHGKSVLAFDENIMLTHRIRFYRDIIVTRSAITRTKMMLCFNL